MTLYLKIRDQELAHVDFITMIESTISIKSIVSIETFGKLLCSLHATDRRDFILEMTNVSKLSGAPWRQGRDEPQDEFEEALDYLRKKLKRIANDYGLEYSED